MSSGQADPVCLQGCATGRWGHCESGWLGLHVQASETYRRKARRGGPSDVEVYYCQSYNECKFQEKSRISVETGGAGGSDQAWGGVCTWGRSWFRPPAEGMKSSQAWGAGWGMAVLHVCSCCACLRRARLLVRSLAWDGDSSWG